MGCQQTKHQNVETEQSPSMQEMHVLFEGTTEHLRIQDAMPFPVFQSWAFSLFKIEPLEQKKYDFYFQGTMARVTELDFRVLDNYDYEILRKTDN